MSKKHLKGWLKHGDFILLDILCLQISFLITYWILRGSVNMLTNPTLQYQNMIFIMSQLLVIVFANNYEGILRRKHFDEAIAVIRYMLQIFLTAVVFLFVLHNTAIVSRLQYGLTSVFFIVIDYFVRGLNKRRILAFGGRKKKSLVLITSSRLAQKAMEMLTPEGIPLDYIVSGIILLDSGRTDLLEYPDVAIGNLNKDSMERITRGWVDEVFIYQPNDMCFPAKVMEDIMTMGITVNYTEEAITDERWPVIDIRKLGRFKVLTNSVRFASAGELAAKRLLDIIGGLVGTVITGILYVFLAPAIKRQSPGPAFFAQERVGRNGKKFKMFKFRSMYMDAEKHKAALMEQNTMTDGMMFKLEDDPRIIGSEKKDKNGKPKGIGNFIRNTSLDEFPQFINVLVGQMSLVGTRPPTVDEWENYSPSHRARMSFKPGITGIWQVSGRSQITDFDEVVKLDCEYIENWSILLDIKILLKTVVVVAKRKGAK